MTIIVLDTNAMPHGQFSSSALDVLRTVTGRGASIVVPEVVVWEWAEHAQSAHVALEESIKRYRVDGGVLTRPSIEAAPLIEELVGRIEALLPHDVVVWRPSDDSWRAAVRDQILQVGSGETKGDVKTGASDAVVLACVEHESYHAEGAVVLLTSDKLLRKNVAARFDNVRSASGTGGLLQALNTFVPATDDLAVRLMEDLPTYLNERFGDYGETLPFHDLGVALEIHGEYFGPRDKESLSSLSVTHVDVAEVQDLRVESNGEERLVLADLRLFGTISGEVLVYREVTPGDVGATREIVDFSSDVVDVTIAVRWDHNWQIETTVPTGIAVLVVTSDDDEGSLRFRGEEVT